MPGTSNRNDLERSVEGFIECIAALPAELFLKRIIAWTPRDVAAHLIGWNRYTIEGCRQLQRGESPFYLLAADDDFRTVNASSVEKYSMPERAEVLDELRASFRELQQFLLSVAPTAWDVDDGVRYHGRPVTIRNTIAALSHDYRHHATQITRWARKARGT